MGGRPRWTERRARLARSARVARLASSRGAAWAGVRVRRVGRSDERRRALDEQFTIRTAEQAAAELGQMKGVLMKAGQLIGFIAESLPEGAKEALASLQADAPPMAPGLAASVVRDELGADPERIFRRWEPVPVAAASIGQVHRVRLHDGRTAAVKVQYPGVAATFHGDLANAELLYALFSRFALPGLDPAAIVDELRARMVDELDYRIEAANQRAFAEHYRSHPYVRVPAVIDELSTERVLVTEWVDGLPWREFVAGSDDAARQRAGEILFRFAQGSVHRFGAFNGDPHPGNYRFNPDGSVTFLDFGLVKRWDRGEWERLAPCMDAIVTDHDAVRLVAAMESAGFLRPGHGLGPDAVYAYVSSPYVPYLTERFTFTPDVVATAFATVTAVNGPHQPVIRKLDMPASFVVLDRVVWGVSALLGRLRAEGPWRAILDEYRLGGPPATALGVQDRAWWNARR
jgi:predicted unusual protein kinase regulating ubiquinone biosynthesis (AarF/ABC1/UbiB family)